MCGLVSNAIAQLIRQEHSDTIIHGLHTILLLNSQDLTNTLLNYFEMMHSSDVLVAYVDNNKT